MKYLPAILCFLLAVTGFYLKTYNSVIGIGAVYVLILIINRLGEKIILLESIAFLYILTCLVAPALGYEFYSRTNILSAIWVKYMPIGKESYFDFVLPAVFSFSGILLLPIKIGKGNIDEKEFVLNQVSKIKSLLKGRERYGVFLVLYGILFYFVSNYLPASLQFFSLLFFFSSFAGILYVYYSPKFRIRKAILILFIFFIVSTSLNSGMFTVVIYMGITLISFLLIGKRISMARKIIIFALGILLFTGVQNTKVEYRNYLWIQGYEGNRFKLFSELFLKSFTSRGNYSDPNTYFPLYVRANQGYNIALVIRRIPNYKNHDKGDYLFKTIASSVVPRFLWPDKPEAGGKFNMEYYTGMRISGFSTNVGTVGEAYGSFGFWGGVLFMIILGLFIRWFYYTVIKLTIKFPLLICWVPVLFFQTIYSGETDTLQIMNSLIKTSIFIWMLFKAFPSLFPLIKNEDSIDISKEERAVLQY